MPRGKPINLSQVKQIIVAELIGSTSYEISQQLNLNQQTVDRTKKREDYYKIRKHLADYLTNLSTSELMRL